MGILTIICLAIILVPLHLYVALLILENVDFISFSLPYKYGDKWMKGYFEIDHRICWEMEGYIKRFKGANKDEQIYLGELASRDKDAMNRAWKDNKPLNFW